MKNVYQRIKERYGRILWISLGSAVVLVIVVIAGVSPLAKYLVEKHGEEFIGRRVAVGRMLINPFFGRITAYRIIVYEKGSTDTAAKADKLYANIAIMQLFFGTFELSAITLDRGVVNVIQDTTEFNFDDLIPPGNAAEPVHFRIRNMLITDTEVRYYERSIPVAYSIKNIRITCPLVQWDVDSLYADFAFESGSGSGTVRGSLNFDKKSLDYGLHTIVEDFDLRVLEQYMRDFADYGNISAFLDADIRTQGNLNSMFTMRTDGKLEVRDFHFGKTVDDDYISFERFLIDIDSLYLSENRYSFRLLVLDSAYLKYERYDDLDNFSRMFGEKGRQVKEAYEKHGEVNVIFMVADFIAALAKNMIRSEYRVDELSITNSRLLFNDYSLLEKFSVRAERMNISVRDVDSRKNRMYLTLKTTFFPFGDVNMNLDVNPADFGDFKLNYAVHDLPLPVFNPYFITYTSFPFHRGEIQLSGTWNVADRKISSNNHLSIVNPTPANKIRNRGSKHVPVPLLMSFIRDFNRTIDFNVPISGDLNDPKYHLGAVILNVIENIFVKPPALPFTISRERGRQEKEDRMFMEWMTMQGKLSVEQKNQLQEISRYLKVNPQSHLTVSPDYFERHEKEMILLFEAKRKYFSVSNHLKTDKLSEPDSIRISKMSIKDPSFVEYLNLKADPEQLEFSVLGKCQMLIGQNKVDKKYLDLINARRMEILGFFAQVNQTDRITFDKVVSSIPRSGFSSDQFHYQLPETTKAK